MRAGFYNLGQLTTVTSPADALKTDYDAAGRPVKQVRTLDAVNYTAERRYDSAGRPLGITYPDGDVVGTPAAPLVYDSAGRLIGIPGIVQSVMYDAAGRALVQTNANGSVTTRSYDPERGFLTGIGTTSSAGTIQNLTYTLDAAGLVEQVTSPFANESWSYSYDDLYRLTQATSTTNPTESQAWAYDEIGRITSNSRVGSYTYPAIGQPRPHAPLTAGSNNYSYDANGNMYAGAGRTITWTRDNLPSAVTMGSSTTSFTYGGAGERLRKQNGSNTSLYPFGDDYEVNVGVVTKYIRVDGLGLVAKRVTNTTYWLHLDRLGSVVGISDATGAVAQRRSFRAYGQTIASQTGHVESRGWIDQRNDAETGLTYLHARYYDAEIGCFISPDPLDPAEEGVGLNRYSYGSGNAVNATDRSGLRLHFEESVTVYADGPPDPTLGGSPWAGNLDGMSPGNYGGGGGTTQPTDPPTTPVCDPATDPSCKSEPPPKTGCQPGEPGCKDPNKKDPPKRGNCRGPDAVSLQGGFGVGPLVAGIPKIGWALALVTGGQVQVTVDRFGSVYLGGGPAFPTFPPGGFNVQGIWLLGGPGLDPLAQPPPAWRTQARLEDALAGWSVNYDLSLGLSGGFTGAIGVAEGHTLVNAGGGSAGFGQSVHYAKKWFQADALGWSSCE